jgi:hypothetical protein
VNALKHNKFDPASPLSTAHSPLGRMGQASNAPPKTDNG